MVTIEVVTLLIQERHQVGIGESLAGIAISRSEKCSYWRSVSGPIACPTSIVSWRSLAFDATMLSSIPGHMSAWLVQVSQAWYQVSQAWYQVSQAWYQVSQPWYQVSQACCMDEYRSSTWCSGLYAASRSCRKASFRFVFLTGQVAYLSIFTRLERFLPANCGHNF